MKYGRLIFAIMAATSLLGVYLAENIIGWIQFRSLCRGHSGLQLFEPPKSNEGWQTNTYPSREIARYLLSQYPQIAFVRYITQSEGAHDLIRTAEKKDKWDNGFRPREIDITVTPLYEYSEAALPIPHLKRTNSYTSTIKNVKTNQIALTYTEFSYRLFDPDWGLGRGMSCPLNRKEQEIAKALSK